MDFLLGKRFYLISGLALALWACACGRSSDTAVAAALPDLAPGLTYTNYRVPSGPWSIHVVRMDRAHRELEVRSAHARGRALGLSTLSDQIEATASETCVPVAGVNGDFYQRDRAYAGDPRGLQIVNGELISAPAGTVSFWIDQAGQPHTDRVVSRCAVTWPDGSTTAFGLNEDRGNKPLVLYTPALGASTYTSGGRELVLERDGEGPWLPLAIGQTYTARVREIRDTGNTRLGKDLLVLSLNPRALRRLPELEPGARLKLSTGSTPDLRGAATAISGGPVVVHGGKVVKMREPEGEDDSGYSVRSMFERHPRSAVGWDDKYFYLLEVDGRQRGSAGMTLDEEGRFFVRLGCQEAMNLDGGGSATLWCGGRVRNNPCDRHERPIANSLLVVRKSAPAPASVVPAKTTTAQP